MKVIDYSSIFREDLFFTDMEFKDKQEILEFMTDAMVEKGYINQEIKQSIFKREEMSTTELGSLVAIPMHCLTICRSGGFRHGPEKTGHLGK